SPVAVTNVSNAVVTTAERSLDRMVPPGDGVLEVFRRPLDGFLPRRAQDEAPTSKLSIPRRLARRLKLHDEPRAATVRRLVGQRAAERFDERSRDRQTEARPFFGLRVQRARERLEEMRPKVRRDACSVVGDDEANDAVHLVRLDGDVGP